MQQTTIVMVAGRRMEVLREGTAGPTVVLIGGLGADASAWRPLIPALARHARVLAYSRAGLGRSDSVSSPRTPAQVVAELHGLLAATGTRGPVVLVGHSLGGLIARLYVSAYPADVAGLVLLDATPEAQWQRWQALNPALVLADSLRRGLRSAPPGVRADGDLLLAVEQAGRVPGLGPLPDLPLAVVTALAPCPRAWTCRDPAARASWRASHDEWFARTTNGLRLVTTGSSHDLLTDEPDTITQAVEFVIARVGPPQTSVPRRPTKR